MTTPASSNYNLVLYYEHERAPKGQRFHEINISLAPATASEQTASILHNTICGFFRVPESATWDRQLFKSVFSAHHDLDLFQFKRQDNPLLIHTIELSGNRSLIASDKPESFEALDRGSRIIRVSVSQDEGSHYCDLGLDALRGPNKNDQALIAFYNSDSFSQYHEYSTTRGAHRCLEASFEGEKLI